MSLMRYVFPVILLACACSTTSHGTKSPRRAAKSARSKGGKPKSGIKADKAVPVPTREERVEFDRIWELYRKGDRRWPVERDRFKRRSEAAGYLLAGHLMRYYMRVNASRAKAYKQLGGVKQEIVAVGRPCAPFLISLVILERVPTGEGNQQFLIDDITRGDCIDMLERMGPRAVPELLQTIKRRDLTPKGRRLLAKAMGGTRDPRVREALSKLLLTDKEWTVRAEAATALGRLGDPRAIEPLSQAVKTDPDAGVVKRAGKARLTLRQKRR